MVFRPWFYQQQRDSALGLNQLAQEYHHLLLYSEPFVQRIERYCDSLNTI